MVLIESCCLQERKHKEEATVVVNPGVSETRRNVTRERPEVNPTELSQLMDMGFSREHCYEALILTSSLEHATDYLLNNFFPHNSTSPVLTTPTTSQSTVRTLIITTLQNPLVILKMYANWQSPYSSGKNLKI